MFSPATMHLATMHLATFQTLLQPHSYAKLLFSEAHCNHQLLPDAVIDTEFVTLIRKHLSVA